MMTIKIYGGLVVCIFTGAAIIMFHGLVQIVVGVAGAFVLVGWLRFSLPVLDRMGQGIMGIFKHKMEVSQALHEQWKDNVSLGLQERVLAYAERNGLNIEYASNGTIAASYPARAMIAPAQPKEDSPQQEEAQAIPSHVRYEDIQSYIPKDHVLIGVGEGGKVDTREKEIKGLIWIPGSSGAGKSNTTGLRVQEDYERGHRFWGIDPHIFKEDSLSNLVKPYMDKFIEPIAYKQEDILRILNLFIAEVERRKAGSPCWPLTLLYDEIGSQVSDKPEGDIEKEIIEKTKKVIRQAGQETRGFNMNVVAISQDAAGLAFLRKRALLVLGHKTVMMSERELICNERGDIARQMDNWPLGRTVVYGVAIQGILIRQQPLFATPRVTDTLSSVNLPPFSFDRLGRFEEANGEAVGSTQDTEKAMSPIDLRKFLNEAGKMRAQGQSIDAILKQYDLSPGGRNNQNLKALLEQEEF